MGCSLYGLLLALNGATIGIEYHSKHSNDDAQNVSPAEGVTKKNIPKGQNKTCF